MPRTTSPQVGVEPTTYRLTADRSTTELLRNFFEYTILHSPFHSLLFLYSPNQKYSFKKKNEKKQAMELTRTKLFYV